MGSIVTILFVSKVKVFAYIPILLVGFGWSITFFKAKVSLLENLLLGFIIFIVLYSAYAGMLLFIGVPITLTTAMLFMVVSSLLFLFTRTFERKNIDMSVSKEEVLLCFVLSVSFIAKVVSIRGMITPNLSDELTHSYFTKLILETGRLHTYYSPGIHTFFALGSQFGGFDAVYQVLYVTNLMSVYVGIPVYFFFKYVLRNKVGGIVASGLFSLGYPLLGLFYFSGKNSLIFGVSVLVFSFFASFLSNKYKSRSLNILYLLVLFSSFVIHYPTALFVSIFWLCMLISNFKKNWKNSVFTGIGIFVGVLFMVILFYKYNPSIFLSSSEIASEINIIMKIRELFSLIKIKIYSDVFNIFPYLFITNTLLGFVYAVYKIFRSKNNHSYLTLILWTVLSFLFVLFLTILSIDSLFIIKETYIILLFVYIYIYVALGVSVIYRYLGKYVNKDILFTVFIILFTSVVVLVGAHTYRRCVQKKQYNIVKSQDLDVFNWLDMNTSDDEKILINAYSIIPGLVLPSDAGGWITLFSDNMVSSPFWDFSGKTTFENFQNFQNLAENPDNCIAKNYFVNNGYEYYFKGSIPLGDVIADRDKLLQHGWILLYESGNSYVFKIPRCE